MQLLWSFSFMSCVIRPCIFSRRSVSCFSK